MARHPEASGEGGSREAQAPAVCTSEAGPQAAAGSLAAPWEKAQRGKGPVPSRVGACVCVGAHACAPLHVQHGGLLASRLWRPASPLSSLHRHSLHKFSLDLVSMEF